MDMRCSMEIKTGVEMPLANRKTLYKILYKQNRFIRMFFTIAKVMPIFIFVVYIIDTIINGVAKKVNIDLSLIGNIIFSGIGCAIFFFIWFAIDNILAKREKNILKGIFLWRIGIVTDKDVRVHHSGNGGSASRYYIYVNSEECESISSDFFRETQFNDEVYVIYFGTSPERSIKYAFPKDAKEGEVDAKQ